MEIRIVPDVATDDAMLFNNINQEVQMIFEWPSHLGQQ